MTVIDVKGFSGIVPKKDKKFLSASEGQVAENCRLTSIGLVSWRSPLKVTPLAKTGEIKSIYYFNAATWFHWNEDVDVVRGPIAGDTTERTYYTGVSGLRVTDTTLATSTGSKQYPEDSYLAGVPAPTTAPTATLVGTHSSPSSTAYVYTYVNQWGEESAPSPASNIVDADFSTGSVNLTGMDLTFTGDYNPVSKWRIYRVASGTTDAEYLFVAEVTPNSGAPQYNDSTLAADLGEVIPSEGWDLPPSNLQGLTMMGNGIMAGFDGNDIYFSEPFLPYTYPRKYSLTSDYSVVGIGAYGNSLVVTTKNRPYVITGSHPSNMSMEKLSYKQPCVSKRGIVSVAGGVIYPTPTGLAYIGDRGFYEITKDHFTRDDWNKLYPAGSIGAFFDNKYFLYFQIEKKMYVFDLISKSVNTINQELSALWADPLEDRLYFVDKNNDLYEFNAAGTRYISTFKTKLFSMNARKLMSSGKIIADFTSQPTPEELAALQAEIAAITAENQTAISSGLVNGAINDSAINEAAISGDFLKILPSKKQTPTLVVKVFADSDLIFERTISTDKPFRIPAQSRYIDYEIEVSSSYPLQRIMLGSSIRELNYVR